MASTNSPHPFNAANLYLNNSTVLNSVTNKQLWDLMERRLGGAAEVLAENCRTIAKLPPDKLDQICTLAIEAEYLFFLAALDTPTEEDLQAFHNEFLSRTLNPMSGSAN